jgi:hypothetical protein
MEANSVETENNRSAHGVSWCIGDEKSQKCSYSLRLVYLFVCPHATTRQPLKRLLHIGELR